MSQISTQTVDVALAAATPTIVVAAGKALRYMRLFNKDATAIAYWTDDGSVPSATNGTPLSPGTGYEYPAGMAPSGPIKMVSAGTPRINVVYS